MSNPLIATLLLLATAQIDASIVVRYMHVNTEIQARFATTDLLSEIENTDTNATEVVYLAEIPENAFIRSFHLEQNGVLTHGVIRPKDDAEQEYEEARKAGKSAAHLRKTNNKRFELQVTLAPLATIGFNLTYQEVLQKRDYMYRHVVSVRSRLPIVNLEVNVLIADRNNFSRIHVPRYAEGIAELPVEQLLSLPQDDRVMVQSAADATGSIAYISYDARHDVEQGELIVLFNTTAMPGTSEIQVVNGYFLHQYTPPDDVVAANKSVVFVLDKSGSMKGRKLKQLQDAMLEIIDDIGEHDRMSIVTFDSHVHAWEERLVQLTAETKDAAKEFIRSMEAKGGTNVAAALQRALDMLRASQAESPSFMAHVMLLTDGRATVGAKTHGAIMEAVFADAASDSFAVNSISFGADADYTLMKKLASRHAEGGGIARRIFESADAQVQIAGFYHEVAFPLLRHLRIRYLDEAVDASSVVSASEQAFLHAGDEFFQLGRFMDEPEKGVVTATITGETAEGAIDEKTEVSAASGCVNGALVPAAAAAAAARSIAVCGGATDASIGGFVERMWTHMSILKYERMREAFSLTDAERANVAAQIKQLALKYGFVTSQTSMVVVLPSLEGSGVDESALEEDDFDEEVLSHLIPPAEQRLLQHGGGWPLLLAAIVAAVAAVAGAVFAAYRHRAKGASNRRKTAENPENPASRPLTAPAPREE